MVSLDFGLRACGLPSHAPWAALLPCAYTLSVRGDNQAMMRAVGTGRNPTVRYLHRTHRVSVAWLRERFQDV
eukprot:2104493-Lingulodinium_polyedra.AAC.1